MKDNTTWNNAQSATVTPSAREVGVARRGQLRTAGGAGLSKGHISASMVSFSCMASKIQVSMPGEAPQNCSKRGKISGFTAKSRRRMMDKLNEVQAGHLVAFATLTYPASWPDKPTEWKRHIDNLSRDLKRLSIGFFWKLEPQKRGAPHFHLLVWGVRHMKRFRRWLAATWYRIVDSGDPAHLKAGIQAVWVKSRRGVMWYASKYMSKDVLPTGWESPGRFWGVVGREFIPWGIQVAREIPRWLAVKLKRWLRRATGWKRVCHRGQTFYIDNPELWLVRLPDMMALGP